MWASQKLHKFQKTLLTWYHNNKRDLPFRRTQNPYLIWLSEIMLQQTTVATALPYYERFIKKFPDVKSVAQTTESEILTLWQGLGYYSRARNFHRACQILAQKSSEMWPEDFDGWLKLPGIGDYTAAAITSIALGLPHAVVDGNVKRVLARLLDFREDISSPSAKIFFEQTSRSILNHKNPGDHNQAMMELGATLCRPLPCCASCPVSSFCGSFGHDPQNIPPPRQVNYRPVQYQVLVLGNHRQIILEPPGPRSLVKGLWQLPGYYSAQTNKPSPLFSDLFPLLSSARLQNVGQVRHSITNKKITATIHMHPLILFNRSRYKSLSVAELEQIPLGALTRKILHAAKIWRQ